MIKPSVIAGFQCLKPPEKADCEACKNIYLGNSIRVMDGICWQPLRSVCQLANQLNLKRTSFSPPPFHALGKLVISV
ncbi:MAG: hypothetical protein EOO61_22935 [Hymenobacter sp.]|nr:MAG: hypothetical protein EOO61_22935 [Hymenobacter sp.]